MANARRPTDAGKEVVKTSIFTQLDIEKQALFQGSRKLGE